MINTFVEDSAFETPMHEQLYWAERHANDFTIAEHNREWFKKEAIRLREIITKGTQ